MAEDDVKYQRLPGMGRSFVEFSRLYLGPDHLLQVNNMLGMHETYKRFYYGDIQAIVVCHTRGYATWSLVWGFCLAAFLALTLASSGAAQVVLGIFDSIFLVALLVHLALGRTVSTHLRTAVQVEPLRSLHRLPTARRALRRLQPLIQEAQRDMATPVQSAPAQSAPLSGTESAPPT